MDDARNTDWRERYRQALFESDPDILPMRLDEAHKAIRWRICELWDIGAADNSELSHLDSAAYFLGLLRTIAEKKQKSEIPLYSGFASGKQVS
jgi:hypothetical protein